MSIETIYGAARVLEWSSTVYLIRFQAVTAAEGDKWQRNGPAVWRRLTLPPGGTFINFVKGRREPYVNHLLEVATLVAEATDGNDPELVVASLIHDAIEDQEVPRAIIADEFGEGVAKFVEEVTDDKSLDKQERKRLQIVNAHKKSPRAKILKLADKISNLRAVAASPPHDWSVKRRLEYIE